MNRGFYWRVSIVMVAAFAAWMVLWPSIPSIAPPWVRRAIPQRMNLGLDIRGGARLSYDVQIGAAIAARRDRAAENLREQLAIDYRFMARGTGRLSEEASTQLATRVRITRNETDNRELSIRFTSAGDAGRLTRAMLEERGLEERNRSGGTVIAAVKQSEVDTLESSSVAEAVRRIQNRIDEFGLREASITSRGETIVVEVPGSNRAHFEEIQDIIRRTARLEFRLVADSATVLESFNQGGPLAAHLPEGIHVESESVSAGVGPDGNPRPASPLFFTARGPDGKRALLAMVRQLHGENALTCANPTATAEGDRGCHAVPDTYDILLGEDPRESRRTHAEVPLDRKVWRTYTVEHIADVTGDMISHAEVSVKPDTNEPYVALNFRADGTRLFAQLTTDNVHRRFAIVLDDNVDSAPVINEPIRNGSASITLGTGDTRSRLREANNLMVVLRAGSLPAPLSEGTMDFIGPTLGRDTIRSALIAAGIGIALVMIFMAIWYGSAGMIANGAVILNLLIQMAAIVMLGATLTLPGFAGLALTVGMAVDSNVLINERIKEELRSGKSLRAAVDAGYQHAFTAIFDGHVTTFISGVVLLQYGTGPIKGFAVMLLIGIVANLFTGVFATRVVFDWLVRGLRIKKLSLG